MGITNDSHYQAKRSKMGKYPADRAFICINFSDEFTDSPPCYPSAINEQQDSGLQVGKRGYVNHSVPPSLEEKKPDGVQRHRPVSVHGLGMLMPPRSTTLTPLTVHVCGIIRLPCITPEGTRTPNLRIRNPLLYPVELRAQEQPQNSIIHDLSSLAIRELRGWLFAP